MDFLYDDDSCVLLNYLPVGHVHVHLGVVIVIVVLYCNRNSNNYMFT